MVAALHRPCVVEQFVACCRKHLGYDVFIDIAKISGEFVGKQFLVDGILCNILIPKSKSDEKSCVTDIHLVLAIIRMHGHPYMRVVGMMGEIDSQAVLQIP